MLPPFHPHSFISHIGLLKMTRVIEPHDQEEEEDYIDMDLRTTNFCCSPLSKDFEFHMSSDLHVRDSTSSPADELFYKGKLLPLHLPPRLQMVQTLLENHKSSLQQDIISFETNYSAAATTPLESCNISSSVSCPVSGQLNAEDYFCERGTDDGNDLINYSKQSWSKKLKSFKQSSFGLKLKASRAYLKSLFTKSGFSDGSCADAAKSGEDLTVPKAQFLHKYLMVAKRNPFGQIQRRHQTGVNGACNMKIVEENEGHRRSFSSAIKWNLGTKPLPSSSSIASASLNHGSQPLKRSHSAHSEVEDSIEGAIAHCKQSQQLFYASKSESEQLFYTSNSASEHEFRSLSTARIGACDAERPAISRG